MDQAEQIKNNSQETNLVTPLASSPLSGGQRGASAWAVDAACSGNPGPMEYRGIDLATGSEIFHFGPVHGTNNVGEFLAIVHALALLWKQGDTQKTIYSDSYNAILWVKKKQCKTKLKRTPQTEQLYQSKSIYTLLFIPCTHEVVHFPRLHAAHDIKNRWRIE